MRVVKDSDFLASNETRYFCKFIPGKICCLYPLYWKKMEHSVKHQLDRRWCFCKVVHKQEHNPPVQPVWISLNTMLNDHALCKKAIRHVSVRLIRSPSRVNNSLSLTWTLKQSLKTCCKCCHFEPCEGVSHQYWMFKKDSAEASIVPFDSWM